MAKAKELKVRDVLSKWERYYKDMYLLHRSCFCGGNISEKANRGYYFGFLVDPAKTLFETTYHQKELILIEDVRSMKDHNDEFHHEITDSTTIKEVEEKYKELYEKVRVITDWEPLHLPEEGIQAVFKDGESYEYQFDASVPAITITKSLFPGMTHASVPLILYSVKRYTSSEMGDVMDLYFQFPLEKFFTIFMIYTVMI